MSDAVRAFDKLAYVYDDWYRSAKGRQVYEAERSLVDNLLPDIGVGVEIGAGTGVFAEALANSGRLVICLDPSKEMLTRAKRRGLACVLGSAESMPFKRGRLDFAYMKPSWNSSPDPLEHSMRRGRLTRRLLRSSSCSSIGTAHGEHTTNRWESGDPIFRHANFYSLGEVEKLSGESGLNRIEAFGTLTKGPSDPDAGDEVEEPSSKTGVIAVKLAAMTRSPHS